MEFTNDIKFSRKPTSNELLRISYYGKLAKENSNELTLVYGFGDNWDNTTEQKMEKTEGGFTIKIKVLEASTLNFCFKNEYNVWDNNNSFNYISGIRPPKTNSKKSADVESPKEEQQNTSKVCTNVVDNLVDYMELSFEKEPEKVVETSQTVDVLENMLQELFASYEKEDQGAEIQQATIEENVQTITEEPTSLSNTVNIDVKTNEIDYDALFDAVQEEEKISKVEYFNELNSIFDNLISEIKANTKEVEAPMTATQVDIGHEIRKSFEANFDNIELVQNNASIEYTPEIENVNFIEESKELTSTMSEIVKNISLVEEKTNTDVNNFNYDYSDFNEMFAFAQSVEIENEAKYIENENGEVEKTFFNFDSLEFDDNKEAITEEQQIEAITENKYENFFNFENLDFDFTSNTQAAVVEDTVVKEIQEPQYIIEQVEQNNFSDSFHDDEDITTHSINEIVTNTINEISTEVESINSEAIADTTFDEEYAKAIQEYENYFDSLIQEIVTPDVLTESIQNVVTEQSTIEDVNTQLAKEDAEALNTNGVPDEYALFEYKEQNSFTLFTKRVKFAVSTLFTKLPKIFGKEKDYDNN